MRSESIVIIGAGPAGCAAAVQCARLGVMPLLIDRTGRPGGLVVNAFSVENYPGIEPADGRTFSAFLAAFLDRFDVTIKEGIVEKVLPDGEHFSVTTNRERIDVRSVIVATGTRPVPLDVQGAEELRGKGLHYEVVDLLGQNPDPVNVAVIGGGEAGLDYSLSLARAGARVTLLVRGLAYRARGRLVDLAEADEAITPEFGVELQSIGESGDGIMIEYSVAGRDASVHCEGVVAAIGREAGTLDLIRDCLPEPTGIVHTGLPGLFITGDARLGGLGQCGIAVGDGLEAAMAAVRVTEEVGRK